ncbi:MAG: hypothetical protein WAM09_10375 [Anaerolineales bacterium]|jgi:hypothetical protein
MNGVEDFEQRMETPFTLEFLAILFTTTSHLRDILPQSASNPGGLFI